MVAAGGALSTCVRRRPPVFLVGDIMAHGKICYLEIPAKTAEASADFYSTIFGWKVRQRGDGELAFDDAGGVSGRWPSPDAAHGYRHRYGRICSVRGSGGERVRPL